MTLITQKTHHGDRIKMINTQKIKNNNNLILPMIKLRSVF